MDSSASFAAEEDKEVEVSGVRMEGGTITPSDVAENKGMESWT
jgi:hypothetical protein